MAVGGHSARGRRDELLPALHAVQDRVGWISEGALQYICKRLTVPPAEAWGVVTFYHLFATQITRIYTTAGWAEMIAYWEGRVAAGQAAAAVDAAAAAGIGVGTVAAAGGFVVVSVAGGMICYYGYVANQNGCSVGDFCWQTMTNYPAYFWPWQWTW